MNDGPRFPPVGDLVPHVAPMLALEELVEWEPERARATACFRAEHPLVRSGAADGCAAIEMITQTVAAHLGMTAFRRGEPVHVGMVVACRRLEVPRASILPGELLTIDVRLVRAGGTAGQYEGEARDRDGNLVASGSFTLVYGGHLG